MAVVMSTHEGMKYLLRVDQSESATCLQKRPEEEVQIVYTLMIKYEQLVQQNYSNQLVEWKKKKTSAAHKCLISEQNKKICFLSTCGSLNYLLK